MLKKCSKHAQTPGCRKPFMLLLCHKAIAEAQGISGLGGVGGELLAKITKSLSISRKRQREPCSPNTLFVPTNYNLQVHSPWWGWKGYTLKSERRKRCSHSCHISLFPLIADQRRACFQLIILYRGPLMVFHLLPNSTALTRKNSFQIQYRWRANSRSASLLFV